MRLTRQNLKGISSDAVNAPAEEMFKLPEKVLQFGTGVLLRGLPDYFIDKANKQGLFNGRVVVVKSTSGGDADAFDRQNSLYTLCVRGVENGKKIEENIINASISRVFSAKNDWDAILKCAANPDLQVVISNTTEVGITLTKDNVHASPPESFPGKLLAFLYQRFKIFSGDADKGLVIVPTELIPDNGKKLESIVLELAHQNGLEISFIDWLESSNYFCSSLVDRIVPGKMPSEQQAEVEQQLGYEDELMIIAEHYRLWAIEAADKKAGEVLTFSKADEGVIITPDINIYRELKLRLLNGSHTFTSGLAHLAGFKTVKEAMADANFSAFITHLMMEEIAPAITSGNLTLQMAKEFASKVLDRYRNPYLDHKWLSINLQCSSKMNMRNAPVIKNYLERFGHTPEYMALGFAAHLLFMKCEKDSDSKFYGTSDGKKYAIQDDNAAYYSDKWKQTGAGNIVEEIFSSDKLWTVDFQKYPEFIHAVNDKLSSLMKDGALKSIKKILQQKVTA